MRWSGSARDATSRSWRSTPTGRRRIVRDGSTSTNRACGRRSSESPALIHWVARTSDIGAAAARGPVDPGTIVAASRGDLQWRITVPDDGHLPGRGLVPTLIEWSGSRHPADRLPDRGIRLLALAGEHPDPAAVRAAVAALGLSDQLKVTYATAPRLAAMFRTPRGTVTL